MSYIVTNTTNATGHNYFTPDGYTMGQDLWISDIPNLAPVKLRPGQSKDFDLITTRTQILQSSHLRIHVLENRMSVVASADPGTDTVLK